MNPEQEKSNTITQAAPSDTPDTGSFSDKTRITTSVLSVEILGFSDQIEGKVDTGAAQSSLHATEIEVSGGQVSFVFNDRRYRTNVHQSQDVSSADGGTQSRPVVLLNITINGKNLPEVPVNLNDREQMPQKFLIGQDIIKAADFIIDLSDEPTDQSPMDAKPEQEEASLGTNLAKPEVRTSSIAQLGDNPLAQQEEPTSDECDATLASIRQQIVDLLAAVDKLMK